MGLSYREEHEEEWKDTEMAGPKHGDDAFDSDRKRMREFIEKGISGTFGEHEKKTRGPLLGLPDKPSVKKDTNPKDSIGVKKPRCYSAMSAHVDRLVSIGMMEGAMKYGRHNYRAATVRSSVYYDSTLEHMKAWYEGEDIDPDSGLPHVIKAICSLYVLADAVISGNINDDRPPVSIEVKDMLKKYQPLVDRLFERYPNPVPAYTEQAVKAKEEK